MLDSIKEVSERERCTLSVVGQVSGDGRVILKDFSNSNSSMPGVDLCLREISERSPKVIRVLYRVENQLSRLAV